MDAVTMLNVSLARAALVSCCYDVSFVSAENQLKSSASLVMRKSLEEDLKTAKTEFLGQRFKSAEKLARKVRAGAQKHSQLWYDAHYLIGIRLFKQGRYDDALAIFRDVYDGVESKRMQLDSAQFQSLLGVIGTSYFRQGNYNETIKFLEITLRDFPKTARNWETLGLIASCYACLDHNEKAIDIAKQSLQILSENPEAKFQDFLISAKAICEMYRKSGDFAAEKAWKAAFLQQQVQRFAARRPYQTAESELPPGWATDELSFFLNESHLNSLATFFQRPDDFHQLLLLNAEFEYARNCIRDDVLAKIRDKYPNKKLKDIRLTKEDGVGMFLFLRSHSSFLASVGLCAACQTVDVYATLRVALESALYSWLCYQSDSHTEMYLSREVVQTRKEKREIGRVFSASRIIKEMREQGKQDLANICDEIYESLIDKGAHPNISAFSKNFTQEYKDERLAFGLVYMNPDEYQECFEDLTKTARCILLIFKDIYPNWIW